MSYGYDDYGDSDYDAGDEPDYEADKAAASEWAQHLLELPDEWVIYDSETTGLHDGAEPVQIAVLSPTGEVLLDTLCRPAILDVPDDAARIHGITTQVLQSQEAPTFGEIYPRLLEATRGKLIVCYNASFDARVLGHACKLASVERLLNDWQCAMEQYAAYVGEWNAYWGSYRLQKLPRRHSRLHGALGDCRAVLEVIERMAGKGETTDG